MTVFDDLDWADLSNVLVQWRTKLAVKAFFYCFTLRVAVLGLHRLEGMCEFSVQWQGLFSVCEKKGTGHAANKIWGS